MVSFKTLGSLLEFKVKFFEFEQSFAVQHAFIMTILLMGQAKRKTDFIVSRLQSNHSMETDVIGVSLKDIKQTISEVKTD